MPPNASAMARQGHRTARFLPAPLVLALATAFTATAQEGRAQALPQGGVAIHGQVQITQPAANQLLVATQNGPGSNHSAINWQSFNIGPGAGAYFAQPSAASTSINRVVTNTPSALFGSLGSNGHLVLVNQAGIAIGAGAMIDAAGFTASTLGMRETDAIAGRLRFGDAGVLGNALLTVDGQILARYGDAVLIAPQLETGASALVQAPNGATVLAAGQQMEITGRGLEGIRLVVQAPEQEARNLGTLTGDAVGIFAGTLRHSGQITATTAALEGGQVVLKAAGDTYVEGQGHITATGTQGGSVDVLGHRVVLTGRAAIDVSGTRGGGSIRVGGDYQGLNPGVPNAERTYFGPDARLAADATVQGDGGRIIVWADNQTLAAGGISARGGVQGGNGGFAEVSGKLALAFDARADLLAPAGQTGTLLLDPTNITIVDTGGSNLTQALLDFLNNILGVNATINASSLENLASDVVLQASQDIRVEGSVLLTNKALTLQANRNIDIDLNLGGAITLATAGKALTMEAGGSINLSANTLLTTNGGAISLHAGFPVAGGPNEGALTVRGTINSNGGGITLRSELSDVGGNSLYLDGNVNAGLGPLVLEANRIDQVSGTLTAGALTATSTSDNDITLEQAGNSVTSFNATGRDISIRNADALVLDALVASRNLTVATGGALTQSAAASVAGATTIAVGGGAGVTLTNIGNHFGTISVDGGSVAITNATALMLGAVSTSGPLTLTTNGAITQSAAITVGGALSVQAGASNITLTNAGNFFPSLAATGGTIQVTVNGGLVLDSIVASGGFTLLTNGNITQNVAVNVGGSSTLNAGGGNVVLIHAANDFAGNVSANGNIVSLHDANTFTLSSVLATSTATLDAGGTLTLIGSLAASGAIVMVSGGDILLGSGGSAAVINTPAAVTLTAAAGGITQNTTSSVQADSLSATAHSGITLQGSANDVTHVYLGNSSSGAITYTGLAGDATTFTGIDQSGGGDVTLNVDDIGITGPINAAGSTVAIAPLTASRNIRIEASPTTGVLSLSAAELLQVTANVLRIGRLNYSGSLTLDTLVGNLNVGTLQLTSGGDISSMAGSGLGSAGMALGSAVELTSNLSVSLIGTGIFLADDRDLAIRADADGNNSGGATISDSQLHVGTGAGNTGGDMQIRGHVVTVQTTSDAATQLHVQGSGLQSLQATQVLSLQNSSSGTGTLQASTASGAQSLTAGAQLVLGAGTGTGTSTLVTSGGAQTVNALGLYVSGGASGGGTGTGNKAVLQSEGNQTLTVGSSGITVTGGGGTSSDNYALILQNSAAGQQSVTLNGGGITLTGGSSAGSGTGGLGHGSFAALQSNGLSQTITLDSGGIITLTGGTGGSRNLASIWASAGNQSITGPASIFLTGGASGGVDNFGNIADISAAGTQTISASAITLQGGSGGQDNEARLSSNGNQSITTTGMNLIGGAGGGGFDTGNRAMVRSGASQTLTVGANDLVLTGGGGTLSDNAALVLQDGTGSATQTITINNGGDLLLTGGSSTQTNVGGATHGSRALIESLGASQTITLSNGDVVLQGGSAGSRAFAQIYAENGTQTLTGVNYLSLTGGTGGVAGEGNFASINAVQGLQTVQARDTMLQGGGAGTENYAVLMAPTQQITLGGSLDVLGGTSTGSGARIGGRGEGSTNLTLAVTGDVTLQGGTGSGASIGSNLTAAPSGQTSQVTLTAGGDISLAPSANYGVVIGATSPHFLPGSVSVTSTGGSIVLQNGGGTGRAGIASLGDVSLSASGSITQSSQSGLRARMLTLHGREAVTLEGPIQATAGGMAVQMSTEGVFTAGSSTSILTPDGYWRLYLANTATPPSSHALGALAPEFRQYGATQATTVLGSGSGVLFAFSPSLTAVLDPGVTLSKVYDGGIGIDASTALVTVTGGIAGDVVQLSAGAGTLDNRNVGTGKTVTANVVLVSVTSADGKPVFGYTLQNGGTASGDVGTVTPAMLSVTGVTAQNKVYDGTTAATLVGNALLQGVLGNDVVTMSGGTGSFADKNVGERKAVFLSGITLSGADAQNYQLVPFANGSIAADITPALLGIGGITAQSRVYDGTTVAPLFGNASLLGVLGNDAVSVSGGTGNFGDKNVGQGKAVQFAGFVLTGADAGNYAVSPEAGTTADITPATITAVSGVTASKIHDGSAAFTPATVVQTAGAAIAGRVAGDDLGIAYADGAFDSAEQGARLVTLNGITLQGADARNYVLAEGVSRATGTGRIQPPDVGPGVAGLVDIGNKLPKLTEPPLPTDLDEERSKNQDAIVAEGEICK